LEAKDLVMSRRSAGGGVKARPHRPSARGQAKPPKTRATGAEQTMTQGGEGDDETVSEGLDCQPR
jgi:hypothetical protein